MCVSSADIYIIFKLLHIFSPSDRCLILTQAWLEKYPKKAAVLRAAGGGNWFHQFRAVALIRISPFPYIIYNYCAVATNVKYGPYICGTLVGVVPEIFVTLYTYEISLYSFCPAVLQFP